MMEHDFVYNINNFNDVIPVYVISNNIIIKTLINTAKLFILLAKIGELMLTLAFNELTKYSKQLYDYAFGSNHTYAMIVFAVACLATLMIYDKILFIESSNNIYKSFQKRIDELQDQIESLKNSQTSITEDVNMVYRRCAKDIELIDVKRDTRIHNLMKQFKKLEKDVKQFI